MTMSHSSNLTHLHQKMFHTDRWASKRGQQENIGMVPLKVLFHQKEGWTTQQVACLRGLLLLCGSRRSMPSLACCFCSVFHYLTFLFGSFLTLDHTLHPLVALGPADRPLYQDVSLSDESMAVFLCGHLLYFVFAAGSCSWTIDSISSRYVSFSKHRLFVFHPSVCMPRCPPRFFTGLPQESQSNRGLLLLWKSWNLVPQEPGRWGLLTGPSVFWWSYSSQRGQTQKHKEGKNKSIDRHSSDAVSLCHDHIVCLFSTDTFAAGKSGGFEFVARSY